MSHTNSTSNYGLPQWIGTDKPTFLGDFNTAFYDIDAQMKTNADAAASATTTANTAASAATTASTNATTALNTANSAASEAASATSAAASATATANTAATNAATALTASQANNISNLAPAYDPTLTYSVGDLVTYVDTETNTGKLYKCIIAVANPEAFNINKWDDLTTSEVYSEKSKLLGTVSGDGVKTWSDALDELYQFFDGALDKEYLLVLSAPSFTSIFHSQGVSVSTLRFLDAETTSSDCTISSYNMKNSDSTRHQVVITSGSTTFTDRSSLVLDSSYTLKLYKLATE